MSDIIDLIVIGGGINGTGIARDAAGRGLKVLLCEKNDLAQHTSSSSTKLIHGGLRYLEHYEFKLVRDSLIEREVLLRAAPHIIWPLRFVLPHHKGLRPAWLIRLGLFLYDYIGGRKILPPTKKQIFNQSAHGKILSDEFKFGFEYSDCWVDDARLVVLNAVDAKEHGADIRTRTTCLSLERHDGNWRVLLEDRNGNKEWVSAKGVVNAAGPWVDEIIGYSRKGQNQKNLRLIKGSHLITRKLFEGDDAYILQSADNRIIFAIPYENDFTLIGTTDVPYSLDEGVPSICDDEINYLCDLINDYFQKPVTRDDIVASYSGVRPLYDDQAENASVVTRDYVLDLKEEQGRAPMMSVFGGKITTYRKLSESALDKLKKYVSADCGDDWTRDAALPGGNIPQADFDGFERQMRVQYSWLPEGTLHRLLRAYGTRINQLLDGIKDIDEMDRHFGAGLYEAEVNYLVKHEFVLDPNDVLWRRTKLGLHLSPEEIKIFKGWFNERWPFETNRPPTDKIPENEKPRIQEFHSAAS